MKYLKLLVLALCVGTCMLVAWLIYPDAMERAGEEGSGLGADEAIALESVAVGFALGFALLARLAKRTRNREFAEEVQADRIEVSVFLGFFAGIACCTVGVALWATRPAHAVVHLALGVSGILAVPVGLFLGYRKQRRARADAADSGMIPPQSQDAYGDVREAPSRSPFDVPGTESEATTQDILEAIDESRTGQD